MIDYESIKKTPLIVTSPEFDELELLPDFSTGESFRRDAVQRITTRTVIDGPGAIGKTTLTSNYMFASMITEGCLYDLFGDLYGTRYCLEGDLFLRTLVIREPSGIYETINGRFFYTDSEGKLKPLNMIRQFTPIRNPTRETLFDPNASPEEKLHVLIMSRRSHRYLSENAPTVVLHDRSVPSTVAMNFKWTDNTTKVSELRVKLQEEHNNCIYENTFTPTHHFYELAEQFYVEYDATPDKEMLESYITQTTDIPETDVTYIGLPRKIKSLINNLIRRGTLGDPFDQDIIKFIEYVARYRVLSETEQIWRPFTKRLYVYYPDFSSGPDKVDFISLAVHIESLYRYYQREPKVIYIYNSKFRMYKFWGNHYLADYFTLYYYQHNDSFNKMFTYMYETSQSINQIYNIEEGKIIFPAELNFGDIQFGYQYSSDYGFSLFFLLPENE